ncbi:uracil-DNA glycosylase family protein [Variovorax paradoxus]|uniref:uracil-DNA glycosylase family protein n=1 Tax=Variovorax paradoxus TaxID=34073 RepID=UPI00277F7DB7|nr:uracil-DNA glycosylase family protein [Variovorax paradoxus]MDQ0588566.1 uracil-DNA glycosylase [Variovorax paradoxus]
MDALLADIRSCTACAAQLPLGPRPVVQASASARLLIVGQAPSLTVHVTGLPWDDKSGEQLRRWLGIDRELFYDAAQVAIMPMGYCYPGRGRSGDLPPRKECAELWHARLLAQMNQVELTLLIGQYAQRHFLGAARKAGVTETVAAFADYAPRFIPLPHPSPRNTGWFKHHPWFESEVLPVLRERVRQALAPPYGATATEVPAPSKGRAA